MVNNSPNTLLMFVKGTQEFKDRYKVLMTNLLNGNKKNALSSAFHRPYRPNKTASRADWHRYIVHIGSLFTHIYHLGAFSFQKGLREIISKVPLIRRSLRFYVHTNKWLDGSCLELERVAFFLRKCWLALFFILMMSSVGGEEIRQKVKSSERHEISKKFHPLFLSEMAWLIDDSLEWIWKRNYFSSYMGSFDVNLTKYVLWECICLACRIDELFVIIFFAHN